MGPGCFAPKAEAGAWRQAWHSVLAALLLSVAFSWGVNLPVLVGGPDLPSQGKTSVIAPLYLSNFSASELQRVSFVLEYDSSRLILKDIQSLIYPDFALTLGDTALAGRRRLTFVSAGISLPYGSVQLARLHFDVKPNVTNTQVKISQGMLDGDTAKTFPAAAFSLTGGNASRADIDFDGHIALADVDQAFNHVITSNFNSRSQAYEFSGKRPVGAMDIAMLQRHVLGFMPTLPVISQDTTPPIRNNTSLTLSAPQRISGDFYRYQISGNQVRGLLAGEFALNLDAAVFEALTASESPFAAYAGGVEARSSEGVDQLHLYAAGADSLAADGVIMRFTVKHQAGKTASAFKGLASAYLNEGAYAGTLLSRPNGYGQVSTTLLRPKHLSTVAFYNLAIHPYALSVSAPRGAQWLDLLDGRGRHLHTQSLQDQMMSVEVPHFSAAAFIRLRSASRSQTWVLPRP